MKNEFVMTPRERIAKWGKNVKLTFVTRPQDVALLFVLLANIVIAAMQLLWQGMADGLFIACNIFVAAAYLFFLAEYAFRCRKMIAGGKETVKKYFEFNKAEPLYTAMQLVLGILMFVFFRSAVISALNVLAVFMKAPNVLRRFNDETVYSIIVNIIFVVLFLFFLLPFLNVIAVSFSRPANSINLWPKGWTTYSMNYVFRDTSFWRSILITAASTVAGTVISTVIMAMAAYPLSKRDIPLRKTMMIFFMIIMLFSGGLAPKMILMNALNLLNTFWALIFPSVVNVFNMLLMVGVFAGVPPELEESAKLDGANNYRILLSIIVPVAVPMMATVIMFSVVGFWNNLYNSLYYIIGNDSFVTLALFIRNRMNMTAETLAQGDPNVLTHWTSIQMSYILISIVPILCLYPFVLKYLAKGVTIGAVKG